MRAARRLGRRSERAERRRFLAEGPNAVAEALAVPGCVVEVLATAQAWQEHEQLMMGAPEVHLVEDRALGSLSTTVTPQGVVAVCRFLEHDLAGVLATGPRLLAVCADVRDPGNAGTVIRCADAAGAAAVVLTGGAVDPYNAKAVRASAGSLFHLPVVSADDPVVVLERLGEAGLQVLAADGAGEQDLDEVQDGQRLVAPTAWLFGNESWGLPDGLASRADARVRIPLHGRAESLNLATAAALCLYASARAQRPRR